MCNQWQVQFLSVLNQCSRVAMGGTFIPTFVGGTVVVLYRQDHLMVSLKENYGLEAPMLPHIITSSA